MRSNFTSKKIISRDIMMKMLYQASSVYVERSITEEDKTTLIMERIKSIYDEVDSYIENNMDYLVERYNKLTDALLGEDEDPFLRDFIFNLCEALKEHIEEIDERISGALTNWTIERISSVDLAILRLAVAEIFYTDDSSIAITVDQAVELAKEYGDEKSYKFVNGVLGKIVEEL